MVRRVKAATAWSLEVEGRPFPAGDSYPLAGPMFLSTRCYRLSWSRSVRRLRSGYSVWRGSSFPWEESITTTNQTRTKGRWEKTSISHLDMYLVGHTLLSESFPASWRTSVPLESVEFTLGLKLQRGDQSPTRPYPCQQIHEPFCNHSAAGITLREDEGLASGRNHPSEKRPLGKITWNCRLSDPLR
ncbi:hypothetical protein CCUS01_05288 [Colletotrichum cuscutae]|uniref:Uncharacterized protein n=1 Tax=Colletotrichum cuscutae TaxID=1209917 RepID=A0AAI9VBQ8_9PEZI|nr:hypothetical protein CCUS01_05288 [Colletotrichum cuscutae]